jgi:hypothetical protein
VFETAKAHPVLWDEVGPGFEAVPLDSERLRRIRGSERRDAEWRRKSAEEQRRRPDPQALVPKYLAECEAGDTDAWWRLSWAIDIGPHDAGTFAPDLTTRPGWRHAVELGEQRVIAAARAYLLDHEPEIQKWLGTTQLYNADLAGYRAMVLLHRRDPAGLLSLPQAVWEKWAPITLAYPALGGGADAELHQAMVKIACGAAPEEVLSALRVLIRKESQLHDHIFVIRKVEQCWDARLAAVVLEEARDPALKPSCMGDVLTELIERGFAEARDYAESLLALPLPPEGAAHARAIQAARALLLYGDDAGWNAVWAAFQADPALGRAVVTAAANYHGVTETHLAQRLSEAQVAELYVWASRQFPEAEDPNIRGMHAVSDRETIGRWRNSLLVLPKARGTLQAVDQLRRVVRELPEVEHLKWDLLEAQETTYRVQWAPPTPEQILDLARSEEGHLVRNGDQLMELVVESLGRLQQKLQGTPAQAEFLWDGPEPKDETAFSDFVVVHVM